MPRATWPIIIGGCHRSGTSLIRRILNAHPHIYCGPEVKFFRDFYGDYMDDPIGHLRFVASARTILPEADLLEILGQAFITLHERAAARAGKLRWADKNPENVLYLPQWQQLLNDCWLFIHVVRNPLDTLASIKEVRFPLTIPVDLEARIVFYRRYTQAGFDFGAASPDRYYRVIYEELVSRPESTLRALMAWLGEAVEPVQLNFNTQPHQVGLEDPKIAKTTTVHHKSVGRWRTLLTSKEARLIVRTCAPLWEQVDPTGQYEMLKVW